MREDIVRDIVQDGGPQQVRRAREITENEDDIDRGEIHASREIEETCAWTKLKLPKHSFSSFLHSTSRRLVTDQKLVGCNWANVHHVPQDLA